MSLHTLSELTGDFVVYRNLRPFDDRVPGFQQAWREMGLSAPQLVRKQDPAYAQVAVWFLQRFHALHAPGTTPSEVILLGDTLGNDGGAFRMVASSTGWPGSAFIGNEDLAKPAALRWDDNVCIANRWECLADWLQILLSKGLALDRRTIVIVDIDKTALGARGRNDAPIDATRLIGMTETVRAALGPDADFAAFTSIYNELNRPVYKDLTADNQDYLAYIGIMAGAGVFPLAEVQSLHAHGGMNDFAPFIAAIEARKVRLPAALHDLHHTVYTAFQAGDPTPFKDFRREEYRAAVNRMGNLPDDAPAEERKQQEICLTREVWDACTWLAGRGALITSFSDKPDEACAPTPDLAALGLLPVHQTPTHIAGNALAL